MAETEELKIFLIWMKEESEKVGLKLNIQKSVVEGHLRPWNWSDHFITNKRGKSGSNDRFYFLELQNTAGGDWSHWIKRWLAPWKKSYDKSRQCIKKQKHHFANKGLYSQSYVFSSSHVPMWELDHKEGWAPKNWCFQTAMLEKTLESPLVCKEIKPALSPSILREINLEYSLEGLMLKLKFQYFGHLMQKLTCWKRPWCYRKDWRQKEKTATEDEMVRYHHWLNGHESEQTPGDSERQGILAYCSPWDHQSQTQLSNWTITTKEWRN